MTEYIEHYHLERNHQGLGNELIQRPTEEAHGRVECRARLGGVLKCAKQLPCDEGGVRV